MILRPCPPALPVVWPGITAHRARFDLAAWQGGEAGQSGGAGQGGGPLSLDLLPGLRIALPPALIAAVPQRRAEFLAGRACAAMALRDLGASALQVSFNPDRSPGWPPGFTGSISHAGDEVIAIAARQSDHAGLGLDLEPLMPAAQAAELAPSILAPGDAAHRPEWLAFADFVTLVFAAKEAFYKALSPWLGRIIGFHDVDLTGLDRRSLTLRLTPALQAETGLSAAYALQYTWQQTPARVLCLLALPPAGIFSPR